MIVGIDPGTTVGWAVLDFHGSVVASGAKREFDLDSMVAHLFSFGKISLVGCDKVKVPSFVQDVATKLGARVVPPPQDLRVEEKRRMTAGLRFQTHHEMDALASALFALKKTQPLLSRTRTILSREGSPEFFSQVAARVIKEEISIRKALAREQSG